MNIKSIKRLLGRYLEAKYSNGNVVLRYSPSTGRVKAAQDSQFQSSRTMRPIFNAIIENRDSFL